jgi:hypothetical protein
MLSAMRRRLRVSPATVIAGLALVFAMTGGAYAAKKYLITSTKQISPSVLKALRGKAGANGAAGAAGSQGPAGPVGPAGSNGTNGGNGEKGAQGEKGVQGIQGVQGKEGKQGATGATGVSGFTDTLPAGKTETGTWAVIGTQPIGTEMYAQVSFPIPLRESAEGADHFLDREETEEQTGPPACKGTLEHPTAAPGQLCFYTREQEGVENPFMVFAEKFGGYTTAGTVMDFQQTEEHAHASGTWAVTAPEEKPKP